MTVRQMLHSAALRSRQPSITAAAADHLVRMSECSLEGAGTSSLQSGGASPVVIKQLRGFGDLEKGLPLESVGSTTGGGVQQAGAEAAAAAAAPAAQQPSIQLQRMDQPGNGQ